MFISPVVTAVNVLLKSPGIARLSCSMLRDLYVTDAPVTELLNVPTLSMKLMFLTKLPFVSLKLGPYLWTVALSMMSNELEPLPQTMPVSSVYDFVLSNQPLGAANADGTNASASTSVAAPPSPIDQRLTLYMSPPFTSVLLTHCERSPALLTGQPAPAPSRCGGRRRPRSGTRSTSERPERTS